MGKRSRKRATTPAPERDRGQLPAAVSKTAPSRPSRRARLDEAPKPVWAPFPLTELSILISLVVLVVGLVNERPAALAAGLGLLSLASGELAIREHFAGYRSHSGLLGAMVAIIVAAPLYLIGLPSAVTLLAAALVFAIAFKVLRDLFADRSGGLKFRV